MDIDNAVQSLQDAYDEGRKVGGLTPDQIIRAQALDYATRIGTSLSVNVVEVAEHFTEYIRTGKR